MKGDEINTMNRHPDTEIKGALVNSANAEISRRRFCLLCQGAGGWPVAVLVHDRWTQEWKKCHACNPNESSSATDTTAGVERKGDNGKS
jgi:hypothetical protein